MMKLYLDAEKLNGKPYQTHLRGMEWFIQVKLSKLLRASELFNFFSNFHFGNTKLLDNFVTKWLEFAIII